MTQYWVSQVISGSSCMQNENFRTVRHKKVLWKVVMIQKIVCDFTRQTVLIPPHQNVSIPSDQNVLILIVSNMKNGNITTFWYEKSRMKSWYSYNLCEYCWFFLCDTPTSLTTMHFFTIKWIIQAKSSNIFCWCYCTCKILESWLKTHSIVTFKETKAFKRKPQ